MQNQQQLRGTVLLFGGTGAERLVSVASAQNIAPLIDAELWFWSTSGEVYSIELSELLSHNDAFQNEFQPHHPSSWVNIQVALEERRTKYPSTVFFLCLHGDTGEDGTLQTMLEQSKLAFTGSGSKASRNAFDKQTAKEIVGNSCVAIPQSITSNSAQIKQFGMDCFSAVNQHDSVVIKPVASGSSDGLLFASTEREVEFVIGKVQKRKPQNYLIEEKINGTELTVGVVEHEGTLIALPCSEIRINKGTTFDYTSKYLGIGSQEITPAEISTEASLQAQDIALKAHRALGCRGYSRTDLFLTDNGCVFIETNTLPGLTKSSFVPQQLSAAGIGLQNFLTEQLEIARVHWKNG